MALLAPSVGVAPAQASTTYTVVDLGTLGGRVVGCLDGLLRLDQGTLEVRQVVVVGGSPGRIAWSAGAVWVADPLEGTVSRVVP